MWAFKYGQFNDNQECVTKKYMQKQIYFLLLYVENKDNIYQDVNVNDAFDNLLTWFGGLNETLNHPCELVRVIALLEAAKLEYQSSEYAFNKYRKLILDAGAEVMRIKGVE